MANFPIGTLPNQIPTNGMLAQSAYMRPEDIAPDRLFVNRVATAIPSASSIDLTSVVGDTVHVTGTTNITTITVPLGRVFNLVFDGILTITHGANLVLPGFVNITTYNGFVLTVVGDASSVTRVVGDNQQTGMVLLATLTPTAAANLDFLTTFSSVFDNYEVIGTGIEPASNSGLSLRLAVSGTADTAQNYWSCFNTSTSSNLDNAGLSSTIITSGNGANFNLKILNVNDTGNSKTIISSVTAHSNVAPAYGNNTTVNAYSNTSVVTGFRLYWSTGANFSPQGKVRVYGIKQ